MKKFLGMLLVVAMVLSLVACGKKPSVDEDNNGGNTQTTTQQTNNSSNTSIESNTNNESNTSIEGNTSNAEAGDNQKTDVKQLGKAISYQKDGEGNIVFSIKTSADIKRSSGWLGLCPLGIYLTEEAADAVDSYYAYFDSSYEEEWFDGIYTFKLEDESIECATYTMVLCDDDDCGNVIGEWIFNKDKSGNIEIGFDDAWLKGAGEGRNPEEFDSLGEEVESWFTFNEYSDEWSEFFFDGYYLETIDPQEYDSYYLMVCPEGDYATYNEAMEAHIGDYSGINERCPYVFSIYHSSIEPGKYTMVLARDGRNDLGVGGNVEIQFGVEKVNDTKWKMDFSNAKCPALESKYADEASVADTETETEALSATPAVTGNSAILASIGLSEEDIKSSLGFELVKTTETDAQYMGSVAYDSSDSFAEWVESIAESCRKASKDGNIYESEFSDEAMTSFDIDDSYLINMVQFIYRTSNKVVYVTLSSAGSEENTFLCNIQVY